MYIHPISQQLAGAPSAGSDRAWLRRGRWGRAVVRGGLGMVVVAAVVLGWASLSGAQEDEEVVTEDVRCLKTIGQMTPDSVGDYAVEQITPVYGQIQNVRRLGWMLDSLGVPVPGWASDLLGNTVTVEATGPRWYVDEAKTEAEDNDNCALARWTPTGGCENYQVVEPDRYGSSSSADPDNRPIEPDVGNRNGITGFLPDRCWGPFPADSYDLHYDNGGFFSWDRKIWAGITGFLHSLGKGAMQISLGLLGFAFSTFHVLDYKDVALDAATNYDVHLVGPFGLKNIAWFALVAFVAIKALRGKLAIAGGEIVMSLVMMTLAATLMANRQGYLEGSANTMDELTTAILAAGNGEEPTSGSEAVWYVRPVQKTLFDEFVDRPFDYINFGGEISDDTCVQRRNRILWAGVPNDGGWAIRYMDGRDEDDTACDAHAVAMGVPTGGRMLIALITMVVCIGVALVVGGAALTMLIAKLLLLVLFALAPFAALGAILPGLGRRMAWGWVAVALQSLAAGAGMAFVLSLFLLGFKGMVDQTDELGPFERWVVMLAIVGVIYMMRHRILAGSKTLANSVADNLTRLSPAAAHWQGGSNFGLDLRSAERGIARGAKATAGYGLAQAPLMGLALAGATAGTIATSWGRFRSGRIALRNLRKMERYREDVGNVNARAHRHVSFNSMLRRRQLRRAERRGGGPGAGPGPGGGPRPGPGPGGGPRPGPGPGGGPRPGPGSGPRPGGPGGPGHPRGGGPVLRGGEAMTPGGLIVPRGAGRPEPRPAGAGGRSRQEPSGNWMATRWSMARETMRFDRGAEMANQAWRGTAVRGWTAANRGWDRSTAAVGRGAARVTRSAGHPGQGGRPLRMSTLRERWAERSQQGGPRAVIDNPGWYNRQARAERVAADRRYQAGRASDRQAAQQFGPHRRRLRPDEREQLGRVPSPRQRHHEEMQQYRARWADPEARRVRDQPVVRPVVGAWRHVRRNRGGGGGSGGSPGGTGGGRPSGTGSPGGTGGGRPGGTSSGAPPVRRREQGGNFNGFS